MLAAIAEPSRTVSLDSSRAMSVRSSARSVLISPLTWGKAAAREKVLGDQPLGLGGGGGG